MNRTVGVRRRKADLRLALVSGAAYVGLAPLARLDPAGIERTVFRTMNGTSGPASALRVPQQLGTPWLLPALGLVGLLTGRPHLAVSATLALPLEKALEVGVKVVVRRRRPAQVLDARLHDDAPSEGGSYPSGHAAIATCAAVLVMPYLPAPSVAGLATAASATTFTRVHQGAHFPLDAVGGVLMGLCAGASLSYLFGLPPSSSR